MKTIIIIILAIKKNKNNKNLSNNDNEEELNVCDGNISNEETLDLTDKFEENSMLKLPPTLKLKN